MLLILVPVFRRVSWRSVLKKSKAAKRAPRHAGKRSRLLKPKKKEKALPVEVVRPRKLTRPPRPLTSSLEDLRGAREDLISKSRADSTWKQYKYAFGRFQRWADGLSVETLPASTETAELYLTFVALSTESVAAAVSASGSPTTGQC